MALPAILKDKLRLPVVGAPLFIVSHPALTLAQCKAGVIGAFPALNARPESQLDEWLAEITEGLAAHDAMNPDRPAAPFAVNQIVHRSNTRLEHDLAMGGLAIFVRVDDGQEEARALAILREHARNVHVHEVDLAKTLRDIPLGRIRPDPWLDDRPLAAPPNS